MSQNKPPNLPAHTNTHRTAERQRESHTGTKNTHKRETPTSPCRTCDRTYPTCCDPWETPWETKMQQHLEQEQEREE